MERLRGCLSSYNGQVRIFPSKADLIMSRYRPIAPKPSVPCISEADKSASSAITFDHLSIRQVPDAPTSSIAPLSSRQKNKRVRKRPNKESDALEPNKRLAMGSLPNLAAEKGISYGFAADIVPSNIQDDVGFMERAAASAPSSVFPLEKTRKTASTSSYGNGGCFTEMIRGIAGLPSATQVHNLLQQQQQPPNFCNVLSQERSKQQVEWGPEPVDAREVRDYVAEVRHGDASWSCFSGESARENVERGTSEDQQQSGLDEENSDGEDDGRRRVVTLNLLPEAPRRGESPSISTCTSSPKSSVQSTSAFGNSLMHVEQIYGQSSEPVVLVDDASHMVLWVNQGYVKACKDNLNAPVSFIDPLGIPTQLGKFQVQLDCQSECISATLWGFLKKLVVDLGDRHALVRMPDHASVPLESATDAQWPRTSTLQQQHCHGMLNESHPMASTVLGNSVLTSRVITPQPIRLVGSVVSLESVTEIQNRDTSQGTLDLVRKQLEEDSLPGFITDEGKVVRYVNPAYKVMVGQPECPWLISTMKAAGGSPTIAGEVLLACNVEIPDLATCFSGRANVQWTRNTGERSCMTVPCDVSSLVDSNARRMLVWKFDIQASLSLTCGIER